MTIEQLAISVTPDPESVAAVRHFVDFARRVLTLPVDSDVLAVLTSELVANAVQVAEASVTVSVTLVDERIRVEVLDHGFGLPELQHPSPFDSGRGPRPAHRRGSGRRVGRAAVPARQDRVVRAQPAARSGHRVTPCLRERSTGRHARGDGFHMPAETAPHAGCWMAWPQRPDTWRDHARPAQEAFAAVANAIVATEPVTMAVRPADAATARAALLAGGAGRRADHRRRVDA